MTEQANGSADGGAVTRAHEQAHRAVLDHVLMLVSNAPWADALVLRGSMAMLAWAGDRARRPNDLDWIVMPSTAVPIDQLHPYPYVDGLDTVQEWPEAGGGGAAYELYRDEAEAYETGGLRPVTPPEGTFWIADPYDEERDPSTAVFDLLLDRAVTPCGVRLDIKHADVASTWEYADYDFGPTGGGGVRMLVPWTAEGGLTGQIQLDFALDEWMPEPPVFALVPRADDLRSTVVRTASRELSLAWKLLWMHRDAAAEDGVRGKDLFDAVLLAESPRTRLEPRLLRRVFTGQGEPGSDLPTEEEVRTWPVDWRGFRADNPGVHGDVDAWQARLARAVAPLLSEGSQAADV